MSVTSDAITALARYMPQDKVELACQLVRQEALPKLHTMAAEIAHIRSLAPTEALETAADEGRAAELVNRGEIALKELTALRRKHVDPLNEEVKAINALFKVLTEPLEAIVGKGGPLDRAILAYRNQERARRQREADEAQRLAAVAAQEEAQAIAQAQAAVSDFQRRQALAAAEAASKRQTVLQFATPPTMTKGVRTESGTLTETERWTFEIIDAAQVPREFCRPDQQAIRLAVASGARQIPGVHITQAQGLTRRR